MNSTFCEKRVACKNCRALLVLHVLTGSALVAALDQEIECVKCGLIFCVGEDCPIPIIAVYKEVPARAGAKQIAAGHPAW